ncbi:MAG: ABC transporter G family protein [uncultured Chthoniobacterales bacterium]|uniref:ABC transporter G family protein n=1 Tax=uncultured Chthoniobacterales bacterium TaxID=1836801 RepID=A0A6J4HLA9_9BACT|nr:MAG: ABC transporter G family protein [uncultured Chthoniobacterales bacterium]
MPEQPPITLADKIDRAVQRVTPFAYRMQRKSRRWMRRALRKPRSVAEAPNLLPLLIQVLASFSKADGVLLEEEIDSSLGFLRYDYPEAVYSELRQLFRQALYEQQDLGMMAQKLSEKLSADRKIMLGVQLYDLISQAGLRQEQVVAFYSFMSQLGMAAQAIDIVYQLNASEDSDVSIYQRGASPLESVSFGPNGSSDVLLKSLKQGERLLAFRYHDLILLKNYSAQPVSVRGRPLLRGGFCRIYPGQRILIGDNVLTYQELAAYFNAKKNVSLPQIYIRVPKDGDQVQLERSRSRESSLEITFGLKVKVKALRPVDAVMNGAKLKAGEEVEATLDDKIIFHNDSEMDLSDLRRRARAMGGRFQLQASKSEYLVSNNPSLLEADDILLSPGTAGDVLLKIFCDYDARVGTLEVIEADRPIMVGETTVRGTAKLQDGDTIRIDVGQFLRCNFSERIIEEERNIIRSLEVADLNHRFSNSEVALDGISFAINRGELVCVMGASGSGKSTLLKVLGGQIQPSSGQVLLNDQSLYGNLDELKRYVSYIPQEDAFDEHLTIGENLQFAAAIRSPHLSRRDRTRRLESKLIELGLSERRDSVVGSPIKKTLSGGERKRLNIGLDMIGNADVYLFDEPTSGLSSKDSEHVIEIIRGMAHNKIIVVTIHQPSSKIFQMFHKAILFDKGGRLVFFGTPNDMLRYFAEAEHQHQFGADLGACPSCGTTRPEFIFDVLETPLRDISGDVIYEENNRGQLIAARRYSPEFWRDKYEAFRLIQDVKQVSLRREPVTPLPKEAEDTKRSQFRWHDEWTQLRTLLRRSFMSKLRNRANLWITMGGAPILALLVGTVLRYSAESGTYDYASAYHIPQYLFITLLVAMFLGLMNSADDIIRDRAVLQRERNLNVRLSYYVFSKTVSLGVFALVQCVLFVLIANAVLSVRGMFWVHLGIVFMTAMGGVALGLVVSSLVSDPKTASNIVPLILIPQMILGGALIKFEDMNRNLGLVYTFSRWFSENPNPDKGKKMDSKLKVPFVCQFIAMRWSYEEMVVAQAKLNPLTKRQERAQREIDRLVDKKDQSPEAVQRLRDLKESLAVLSGLEAHSAKELDGYLATLDEIIGGKRRFDRALFQNATGPVTAEQLYVNQKVSDLISNAEMEQNDYRRGGKPNVFFGAEKRYLGTKIGVFTFNTIVLVGSTIALLGLLLWILRRQLEVRRG